MSQLTFNPVTDSNFNSNNLNRFNTHYQLPNIPTVPNAFQAGFSKDSSFTPPVPTPDANNFSENLRVIIPDKYHNQYFKQVKTLEEFNKWFPNFGRTYMPNFSPGQKNILKNSISELVFGTLPKKYTEALEQQTKLRNQQLKSTNLNLNHLKQELKLEEEVKKTFDQIILGGQLLEKIKNTISTTEVVSPETIKGYREQMNNQNQEYLKSINKALKLEDSPKKKEDNEGIIELDKPDIFQNIFLLIKKSQITRLTEQEKVYVKKHATDINMFISEVFSTKDESTSLIKNEVFQYATEELNKADIQNAETQLNDELTHATAKAYVNAIDEAFKGKINCNILAAVCEKYDALKIFSTVDMSSIETSSATINDLSRLKNYLIKTDNKPKTKQVVDKLNAYIVSSIESMPRNSQLRTRVIAVMEKFQPILKSFDTLHNYRDKQDFSFIDTKESVAMFEEAITLLQEFELFSTNVGDVLTLKTVLRRMSSILIHVETVYTVENKLQLQGTTADLIINYNTVFIEPNNRGTDQKVKENANKKIQFDLENKPEEEILADIYTDTNVPYNIFLYKTRYGRQIINPKILGLKVDTSGDKILFNFFSNVPKPFNKKLLKLWSFENNDLFVDYATQNKFFVKNRDVTQHQVKTQLKQFNSIEFQKLSLAQIQIGEKLWTNVRKYIKINPYVKDFETKLKLQLPQLTARWEKYEIKDEGYELFPHLQIDSLYEHLISVNDDYLPARLQFVAQAAEYFSETLKTAENFENYHSEFFRDDLPPPTILIAIQAVLLNKNKGANMETAKVVFTSSESNSQSQTSSSGPIVLPFTISKDMKTLFQKCFQKQSSTEENLIAGIYSLSPAEQINFSKLLTITTLPLDKINAILYKGISTGNFEVDNNILNSNLQTAEAKNILTESNNLLTAITHQGAINWNLESTQTVIKDAFTNENIQLIRFIFSQPFYLQNKPNINIFLRLFQEFPKQSKPRTAAVGALLKQMGYDMRENKSDYEEILNAFSSSFNSLTDDNNKNLEIVNNFLLNLDTQQPMSAFIGYESVTQELAFEEFQKCNTAEDVQRIGINYNSIAARIAAEKVLRQSDGSRSKEVNNALLEIVNVGYSKIYKWCTDTRGVNDDPDALAAIHDQWSRNEKESYYYTGVVEFCIAFDKNPFELQTAVVKLIGESNFKKFIFEHELLKSADDEAKSKYTTTQVNLMRFFIGKSEEGTKFNEEQTINEVHNLFKSLWFTKQEDSKTTIADQSEKILKQATGRATEYDVISFHSTSYTVSALFDLTKGNDYLYFYETFKNARPLQFVKLLEQGEELLNSSSSKKSQEFIKIVAEASVGTSLGNADEKLNNSTLGKFSNFLYAASKYLLDFYLEWTRNRYIDGRNYDRGGGVILFLSDAANFAFVTVQALMLYYFPLTNGAISYFLNSIISIVKNSVGRVMYGTYDYILKPSVQFTWDKLKSLLFFGSDKLTNIFRNLFNLAKAEEKKNICAEADKLFLTVQSQEGGQKGGSGWLKKLAKGTFVALASFSSTHNPPTATGLTFQQLLNQRNLPAEVNYNTIVEYIKFTHADTNKDRVLSSDEKSSFDENAITFNDLIKVIEENVEFTADAADDTAALETIFNDLDKDNDGVINTTDDLYKFLQLSQEEEDKRSKKPFKSFDADGNVVLDLDAQKQFPITEFKNEVSKITEGLKAESDEAARVKAESDEAARVKAESDDEKSKPKDYYKILGVTPDANIKDIKKAFRDKALQYHPDKNPEVETEKQFQLINEAYDVLKAEKDQLEKDKKKEEKDQEETPVIKEEFKLKYDKNKEALSPNGVLKDFYKGFVDEHKTKISLNDVSDFFLNKMKDDFKIWKGKKLQQLRNPAISDNEDVDDPAENFMLDSTGNILSGPNLEDFKEYYTEEVISAVVVPTIEFVNKIKETGAVALDSEIKRLGKRLNADYDLKVEKGTEQGENKQEKKGTEQGENKQGDKDDTPPTPTPTALKLSDLFKDNVMTPELTRTALKVDVLIKNDPYFAVKFLQQIQNDFETISDIVTEQEEKLKIQNEHFNTVEDEEKFRLDNNLITDDYLQGKNLTTSNEKQKYRTVNGVNSRPPEESLIDEEIDTNVKKFIDNIDDDMSDAAKETYEQALAAINLRPISSNQLELGFTLKKLASNLWNNTDSEADYSGSDDDDDENVSTNSKLDDEKKECEKHEALFTAKEEEYYNKMFEEE